MTLAQKFLRSTKPLADHHEAELARALEDLERYYGSLDLSGRVKSVLVRAALAEVYAELEIVAEREMPANQDSRRLDAVSGTEGAP